MALWIVAGLVFSLGRNLSSAALTASGARGEELVQVKRWFGDGHKIVGRKCRKRGQV